MYGLMLLLAIAAAVVLTGYPLGEAGAATGISSSASRSGASRPASSARASTTSSRAGTRCPTSGGARSPSGRAASASGAGSSSAASRARGSSTARGQSVSAVHGRGRAGAAARAGHRPLGELVEPGAVRQADRPAVGARDRSRAPAGGLLRADATFHPTFLYEFVYDITGVGVLLLVDRLFRIKPPGPVRALRRVTTASAASSRSCCGSIRRTSSSGCG